MTGGRRGQGPAGNRRIGDGGTSYVAGVDLGASKVRAVVADGAADALARDQRETPRGPNGASVVAVVLDLVRSVCEGAGIVPAELEATTVATTGPLDLVTGTVVGPANLPGIERIRLRDPLVDLVGEGTVELLNDATAGAIGERFYADTPPEDLVYLSLSTGIGAGVCVDGRVLSGRNGNAGEVGHLVVDPEGRRTCGCGHTGHWEAYCSGANIPDYARDLHEAGAAETSLPLTEPGFGAADVFAGAGEDHLADLVVDEMARWNAIGLANVVHAYAPAVVTIGGAVALRNTGLVVDPVRERLPDQVIGDVPEVGTASLGDDAVVMGAIAHAVAGRSDER